jgi:adenylylsulfate kinase
MLNSLLMVREEKRLWLTFEQIICGPEGIFGTAGKTYGILLSKGCCQRIEKVEMTDMRNAGFTIWLTGLSGAGKSTLAWAIERYLKALDHNVEVLDGDIVRTHLSKGLGFSREDRNTNIQRIAFVCNLLTRNGVVSIAAAISPYLETRKWARKEIGNFVEIYVKCPLEVCRQRDVKGLYKLADEGKIENFTGVDDPYEEPEHPELVIETDKQTVEQSVTHIFAKLEELGYLEPEAVYEGGGS